MALFWVELDAPDVAMSQYGDKIFPIGRQSKDVVGISALHMIRMDKVEAVYAFQTEEDHIFLPRMNDIPAHVRYAKRHLTHAARKTYCSGINETEPGHGSLLAGAAEQLHAEADSQKGRSPHHDLFPQCINQPMPMQAFDSLIESADPRENQLIRCKHVLGICGHFCRAPDFPEHIGHGTQVAHSIIDNDQHHSPSKRTESVECDRFFNPVKVLFDVSRHL